MGSMHTNLEETKNWDRVAEFYAERARGGVSLMVTGGIAPNQEGGVFAQAAGLYDQGDVKNHSAITKRVHEADGKIAMQILHAGRYAYSPQCVAPSPIKSPISPFVPAELDAAGVETDPRQCRNGRTRQGGRVRSCRDHGIRGIFAQPVLGDTYKPPHGRMGGIL